MKSSVPMANLNQYIRGYRAEFKSDLSDGKKHVYYARPMRKWITVRRNGNMAEMEFTDDCPCAFED